MCGRKADLHHVISIPAPARGATVSIPCLQNHQQNFNSRPCARGDMAVVLRREKSTISIPAPARGATKQKERGVLLYAFQFPLLREGRHELAISFTGVEVISIPAPARGATGCPGIILTFFKFQFPPLREGRRILRVNKSKDMLISIPAPARGATMHFCVISGACGYFNSRPCARGDDGSKTFSLRQPISIPAPARGATLPLM